MKNHDGNTQNVFSIALVVSQFNLDITSELKNGAFAQLQHYGFRDEHIHIVDVPGAVEIPLMAQYLAKQGKYDAIIALGAVIRGETSHYDYVCRAVTDGCLRISLDYHLPVIFGVLTTENEQQAWDRLGGVHGHKGRDAVDAAIQMIQLLKKF